MGAELAPQRFMQQMRGAVMGADFAAAGMIDLGDDGGAHCRRSRVDMADMDEQIAEFFLRVSNGDAQAAGAGEKAGIADLAAAFGIERRLVQQQSDVCAGLG